MFKYNTRVLLPDRAISKIGELKLGQGVAGDGVNTVKGITHLEKPIGPVFKVNHTHIGGHTPIFTTRGWAMCQIEGASNYPCLDIVELVEGMEIITDIGSEDVTTLEELSEEDALELGEFVEISLDSNHTFYADDYLVHNKGGSSQPEQTTTIQKSEPPAYLQPFLTDIAEKAQGAFGQVPQGGFSGDLVSPVNPLQTEALGIQEGIARGLGGFGDTTGQIADLQAQRVLSGDILAPLSERFDPRSAGTEGVIQAALDPVQDRLLEQIIPGIQSQAIQEGAFGGTRQDVTTGSALQDFTREAGNIAANIEFQDFARQEDQRFNDLLSIREFGPELEKINQAAALTAPEIANQGVQQELLPATLLGQAGEASRLFGQDEIDNLYQQYVLGTQTPFVGLDQYAALVNGTALGGTSTLTGPRSAGISSGGGGIGGAIAGGLGGVGIGSALGLAPLGPAGIALGLLGAGAGFFG